MDYINFGYIVGNRLLLIKKIELVKSDKLPQYLNYPIAKTLNRVPFKKSLFSLDSLALIGEIE
jgi:hypothetical protein